MNRRVFVMSSSYTNKKQMGHLSWRQAALLWVIQPWIFWRLGRQVISKSARSTGPKLFESGSSFVPSTSEPMADLSVFPIDDLAAILENGRCRYITATRCAVREFDVVLRVALASRILNSHANHTSKTAISPNPALTPRPWRQSFDG